MDRTLLRLSPLLTALAAAAAWAAWLGWDQARDVHPDGSVSGPYEAWQVVGLVLTLSAPLFWTASRRHVVAGALGTSAGLTAAAWVDWSDDASGLSMIGVVMVLLGSLAATFGASALVASVTGRRGRGRGRPEGRGGFPDAPA
ncbi:hypothetical protein [Streptomyces roseicoloratus]|uniref:Integral membrane protein n=1 Tax=Streptomyces roseicoloratus TaxID=2508722 RepID=A0ABY9RU29_9ACTN|nr:hypothetical protein [Streptomyces roseicoloratus]WMX45470.1 hypothetical protein RGF97_12270 [Streptomyces roseicoloratus]